jgi:predicted MFS family arabinose efflux permease
MVKLFAYKPFLQGAFSGMLYYYGFFTVLAYSPLVLGLSAIQIGFVFFGWGLCLAYGSAVLSHKLEKKWTPKTLLKVSLIVFAIMLVLLFVVQPLWLKIVIIILSGLASGLNNALFTTHVMGNSPYERAITSGGYNFIRWLGAAIAPLLSGVLGESLSPQSPFLVAAILGFVAFLLIMIPVRKTEKTTL